MATHTNVVWIMSDQHAAFASGCYGHGVVQTPCIDRLAGEGMRFTHAYTPSPVCVPARFAALSGRYPHTTGCTGNNTPLPVRVRTAAHLFGQAGYVSAFIGKMHPVDPQTHGFDFLVDMGHYYDYLGPKTETWGRGMDARNTGCGLPWMESWYKPATWLDRPLAAGMPAVLDEADHFEAFVARNCTAFLERHGHEPFFLCASMIKPHFPYASPPAYHALYAAGEMALPASAGDGAAAPQRWRQFAPPDLDQPAGRQRAQAEIADYFAAATFMDKYVGAIVEAVDGLGLGANTLVIYTSDHGEMLYHHGLRQKFVFYEQSVQVPLIARLPGQIAAGAVSSALVDLTDLLPTSLAMAGLAGAADLDGVSFAPVLRGEEGIGRDAVFSELGDTMMIRTRRWKLARYAADDWRLYDLAADPEEMINLYDEQQGAAAVAALRERLLAWASGRRPSPPAPLPGGRQ